MSDSGQSYYEWLTERIITAREKYRGGTRSENPRRADIELGKIRAYKNARTEYLNRKSDEEVEEEL